MLMDGCRGEHFKVTLDGKIQAFYIYSNMYMDFYINP